MVNPRLRKRTRSSHNAAASGGEGAAVGAADFDWLRRKVAALQVDQALADSFAFASGSGSASASASAASSDGQRRRRRPRARHGEGHERRALKAAAARRRGGVLPVRPHVPFHVAMGMRKAARMRSEKKRTIEREHRIVLPPSAVEQEERARAEDRRLVVALGDRRGGASVRAVLQSTRGLKMSEGTFRNGVLFVKPRAEGAGGRGPRTGRSGGGGGRRLGHGSQLPRGRGASGTSAGVAKRRWRLLGRRKGRR